MNKFMEIKNYTSAISAYRYASESLSKPVSGRTQKNKGKNTDKADFSSASRASFSDTLRAAAKSAAESSASPERLAALAEKIANGSYNVSSEEIADSILGQ